MADAARLEAEALLKVAEESILIGTAFEVAGRSAAEADDNDFDGEGDDDDNDAGDDDNAESAEQESERAAVQRIREEAIAKAIAAMSPEQREERRLLGL